MAKNCDEVLFLICVCRQTKAKKSSIVLNMIDLAFVKKNKREEQSVLVGQDLSIMRVGFTLI